MRLLKKKMNMIFPIALLSLVFVSDPSAVQVKVVNMIPYIHGNETNQDSEPNLAVNPVNPLQIVGSAFTPEPQMALAALFFAVPVDDDGFPPPDEGEVTNAPIYISVDGGNTWELKPIVPGGNFSTGTNDITVRFSGSSNVLYASVLRGDSFFEFHDFFPECEECPALPISGPIMDINRITMADLLNATPMEVLAWREFVDQPYIQATTVLHGTGSGSDRVYVGNNDLNFSPFIFPGLLDVSGRTASIDRSLDAKETMPPAGFQPFVIESQATAGQDGSGIRVAVHPNGTVYGVFYRLVSYTETETGDSNAIASVIVVRDDNWAASASPFSDLRNPLDNSPGRPVVQVQKIPIVNRRQEDFGQERFVGSDISIAVDPRNSSNVYVAWADDPLSTPERDYTLHVRRSTDCGATWSGGDLLTITNAKNPALSISMRGKIGFLYQALTGDRTSLESQRWVTHFRSSNDGTTWDDDLVLADVPADEPYYQFLPYIGDYIHLMSVGRDFYGVFSANNTPDPDNFPQGVTYQRLHDFGAKTLLNRFDITTPVDISIDPFFFRVTELPDASDFYVRDWTDNPASYDMGVEPSVNPVFFDSSDVWNRRSNSSGGFNENDQAQNEDPRTAFWGSNYAFARIHRKAIGTDKTVGLHFLKSELGVGSNFVNMNSTPDPVVEFTSDDLVRTISAGYQWTLPKTDSSHVCIAVEISTPEDPIVFPSLLGRAPGWPTVDLMVINDNNKAQRNMGVYPSFPGEFELYAIAHNADVSPRDMKIRYEVTPEVLQELRQPRIEVIGGSGKSYCFGNIITMANMQPGENRWIKLSIRVPDDTTMEFLLARFYEVKPYFNCGNEFTIDGFALAIKPSPLTEVIREVLEFHSENFIRMGAAFNIDGATEEGKAALELLSSQVVTSDEYIKFLQSHIDAIHKTFAVLLSSQGSDDSFHVQEALEKLGRPIQLANCQGIVPLHSSVLHRIDAFLTMLQKRQGDPADILQNVKWQRKLYTEAKQLKGLDFSDAIIEESQQFVSAYESRKLGNNEYPMLIGDLLESYQKTSQALEGEKLRLEEDIANMKQNLHIPATLQKAHRDYLMKLQKFMDN